MQTKFNRELTELAGLKTLWARWTGSAISASWTSHRNWIVYTVVSNRTRKTSWIIGICYWPCGHEILHTVLLVEVQAVKTPNEYSTRFRTRVSNNPPNNNNQLDSLKICVGYFHWKSLPIVLVDTGDLCMYLQTHLGQFTNDSFGSKIDRKWVLWAKWCLKAASIISR